MITLNSPDSQYILSVLEAVEFRWTINDVLEQPQAILDDVLKLRSIGHTLAEMTRKR